MERMTVQQWRTWVAEHVPVSAASNAASKGDGAGRSARSGPGPARRRKYGNKPTRCPRTGVVYDSAKEYRHACALEVMRSSASASDRVVDVRRQQRYLLVQATDKERPVYYTADFVVTFDDGSVQVHDVKSAATRKNRAYVIKRKLMASVHGIAVIEI